MRESLATSHPEAAAQWHRTKNGNATPADVVAGSHNIAWWRCPKGPDHEWEARIYDRSGSCGCPFCAGKRVSVTNSFANLRPDLAAEWHPTKNGHETLAYEPTSNPAGESE